MSLKHSVAVALLDGAALSAEQFEPPRHADSLVGHRRAEVTEQCLQRFVADGDVTRDLVGHWANQFADGIRR